MYPQTSGLSFLPSFLLSFLLSCFLAFLLSFLLSFVLSFLLACLLACFVFCVFLACLIACLLSFFLSFFLTYLLSLPFQKLTSECTVQQRHEPCPSDTVKVTNINRQTEYPLLVSRRYPSSCMSPFP